MALFLSADAELRAGAARRYQEFSGQTLDSLPIFVRPTQTIKDTRAFAYRLDDATVTLRAEDAEFAGVRHEYALDSLIRILLTMVLLPQRGFLLHAASVVHEGRSYVFAGRSGAGKSTVASLSPVGSVLTDEISLLRFSEGQWWAHGTPFWGEFRAAGRNERYPLAGIYALEQAKEDSVAPLSMKEQLRALLPCVLFFNSEPQANQELLSILMQLIEQVPCYRLRFRRDAAFWQVVAA